jgi:predicted GNAT superfamily acetyltransferase
VDSREPARRLAEDVAAAAGVTLAPLEGMEDARAAARVVAEVWGEDLLDPALLWALRFAGNVAILARRGSEPIGVVLGFVGTDDGLHLHSHILGVLPGHRSTGIGFALKLAQRAACLDQGIDEVRWTFDPLVARNGRFNLARLGAVATRFLPSFYGEMRDAVNRGDRSDRFEVRWRLTSPRVRRAVAAEAGAPAAGPLVLAAEGPAEAPEPTIAAAIAPAPGVRVAVPRDYHAMRATDPEWGRRWRDASARAFTACFGAGLVATWIAADAEYVFEADDVDVEGVMEGEA